VGGVFQLVLEDTWYSSHEGDKVVVKTSVDPGTRWVVIRVDRGDGVYQLVPPCLLVSYSIANIQATIRQDHIHRSFQYGLDRDRSRSRESCTAILLMKTHRCSPPITPQVVLSPLADPGTNPLQLWKLIPVLED
jgi:hypothetical protein